MVVRLFRRCRIFLSGRLLLLQFPGQPLQDRAPEPVHSPRERHVDQRGPVHVQNIVFRIGRRLRP
jgi:hypothetical protein